MTDEARRMSGAILLTIPTIAFGGYFLLTILSGEREYMKLTDFQRSMFRAGHAHAGVLVILSLVVQVLLDHARLSKVLNWVARIAFPLAAILISGGFFAAATGPQLNAPTNMIAILYVGVIVFVVGLLIAGTGLVKKK